MIIKAIQDFWYKGDFFIYYTFLKTKKSVESKAALTKNSSDK